MRSRKITLALAVALTFATALALSAEDSSSPDEWYVGKPIASVKFEGLSHIKASSLDDIVKSVVGKVFTYDLFWSLQDALYAKDYFDELEARPARLAEGDTSAVVIIFKVKEKPYIARIAVEGNASVGTQDLLGAFPLKAGDLLDKNKVEEGVVAAKKLYVEKGYADVAVTTDVTPSADGSSLVLRVLVSEGLPIVVKALKFSGNSLVAEAALKGALSLKEAAFLQSGTFQESKLQDDIKALVAYYRERGFVDAQIPEVRREFEVKEGDRTRWLTLTFVVKEGKQYLYGGSSFVGNKIFDAAKLAAVIRLAPGAVLNMVKFEQDFQKIANLYYENGYIFNTIQRAEARDEDKGTISFTITITEKDRAHIEKITLEGLSKTDPATVLRELGFEEGDIFSLSKYQQGLLNLYNLQYFKTIDPKLEAGSADDLMELVLKLEEQSTLTFNFGFNFIPSPAPGQFPFAGFVGIDDSNFLGKGLVFGGKIDLSPDSQSLSFNYMDKWLAGVRWSGGVNFSISHEYVKNVLSDRAGPVFSDDDYRAGIAVPDPYTSLAEYEAAKAASETIPAQFLMSYEAVKLGLGLSTGYKMETAAGWLSTSVGLNLGLQYLNYDATLYRAYDLSIRQNLDAWMMTNRLAATISLDSRDLYYNPSKGVYLSDKLSLVGLLPDPVEAQHYIRNDLRFDFYQKFLDVPTGEDSSFKAVFFANTTLSLIFPGLYAATPAINNGEKLFLDGMTTARGWLSESTKTGFALWTNSAEIRIPISEQYIWFDLFFDAAAVKDDAGALFSALRLSDMRFSFGGGLRFSIPQFPFRFYLAQRFKFDDAGQVVWGQGSVLGSLDFVFSLGLPLY